MVHLRGHVAAELEQPRAVVPGDGPGAENLRGRAGGLGAPDLELEEPVPRGVVALGEEQIVLGFGVDVRYAPFVLEDFHRLVEAFDGEGLLGLNRGGAKHQ